MYEQSDAENIVRQKLLREILPHSEFKANKFYFSTVAEYDFGWVLYYNFKGSMLAGNSPIIFEKSTGNIFATGTARDTEFYIQNYIATGDPHRGLGKNITLEAYNTGAKTIPAIKAIRTYSNLGLSDAKLAIDECLSGQNFEIQLPSIDKAMLLISELEKHGFKAKRLPE